MKKFKFLILLTIIVALCCATSWTTEPAQPTVYGACFGQTTFSSFIVTSVEYYNDNISKYTLCSQYIKRQERHNEYICLYDVPGKFSVGDHIDFCLRNKK